MNLQNVYVSLLGKTVIDVINDDGKTLMTRRLTHKDILRTVDLSLQPT